MRKFIKMLKLEYQKLFTDPGTFLIMIVAVFVYPIVYAVPYAPEVLRDVPIGLIDFDNSKLSREFIRQTDANESVEIVSRPQTIEDAKREFYENNIKGFVFIPKNFEKDLLRGKKVFVSLYCDSAYLIVYKQITGAIQTTAGVLSSQIEVRKNMKQGHSKEASISKALPFELVQMPLYNASGGYSSYIYPIVLILIMQQTLLVGAGLMGGTRREKMRKIISPNTTILAKTTCYTTLYLGYSIVYFVIIPLIMSYKVTYNFSMLLILIPFLVAVSLLSQALVYFFKEREDSIISLACLSLPFLFLPGFIWPKEAMPAWLNFLGEFIPSTNAVDGFIKLNQMDATFSQVQKDFYVLIILCVLYYFMAYMSFKTVNTGRKI